jgi:hypothetical protein
MISALALTLAIPLQIPDFNPRVSRIPVIVAELQKLTGTKLEVGGKLTDEVVFISAQNRTAKEIMDQLAFALEANWIKTEDRYILDRPANWDEVLRRRRAEALQEGIALSLSEMPPSKESTPDQLLAQVTSEREQRNRTERMAVADLTRFSLKTPAGTLLDAILAEVTPAKLAQLATDRRVVIANRPTKMQVPMPPKAEAGLVDFARRHNAVADKIEPKIPAEQPDFGDNAYDSWRKVSAETMKVLMVVEPSQRQITLSVYQGEDLAAVAYRQLRTTLPFKAPDGATLAPLNERSITFIRKRTADEFERNWTLTDAKTLDDYQKATENDFLEYGNAEAFAAIHKRDGSPMIAVIPDTMILAPWMVDEKNNLRLSFFESTFRFHGLNRVDQAGWRILRPEAPRYRVSRTMLEGAFSRTKKEGRMSLTHWAELMSADQSDSPRQLASLATLAGYAPRVDWVENLGVIRFFGSLSAEQKAKLAAKETLPSEAMSDAQKAHLAGDIYDRGMNGFTRIVKSRTYRFEGLGTEPTEALPDGLVPPFAAMAEVVDGESWFAPLYGAKLSPASAPEIAYYAAKIERPDLFPGIPQTTPIAKMKFHKGTLLAWDFNFMVGPNFDLGASLRDEVIDQSKTFEYAQFPEDFRKIVDEEKARIIARFEKLKAEGKLGSGRTGSGPPPHPARGR